MLKLIITLALVTLVLCNEKKKKRYDGYKVYSVTPMNTEQTKLLKELDYNYTEYSFWTGPSDTNASADLMVTPRQINKFEELMKKNRIPYKVNIANVQSLIDNERPKNHTRSSPLKLDWTDYHELHVINAFLKDMFIQHPFEITRIRLKPKTSENREIRGVKLSYGENNPGVFIEGGIHGREWISPATVTYILNEFLTSDDPEVRQLAESNDWYFFPVVNPDGYQYSHDEDRLWRKSRKNHGKCYGTDLNRNWGYKWSNKEPSNESCHETYAGENAFSDPETIALSQFIKKNSEKFYAYISFHSYSQFIMAPYGYTRDHLDNYEDLHAIGEKAIAALRNRHGTEYTTGTAAEQMNKIVHGISMDWVKGVVKLPLTYTYELRNQQKRGFVLPADEIIATGDEVVYSLVALFNEAAARGYTKNSSKIQEPSNNIERLPEA